MIAFYFRALLAFSFLFPGIQTQAQQAAAIPYFSDPALSPDSSEIAFVSGGDIWTVAASGGEARLLVSHPSTESRPLYSPDGRSLAFNSGRTGNGDIYILDMVSGRLTRLTYDDGFDEISAWSGDSKYIFYGSTSRDIAGMRDILKIKATGGTPVHVSDNRYVAEFHPAPSPDGKSIAFAARGVGWSQWWRNGHSHLDESELWLLKPGQSPVYTKLTEKGAKQLWPMWSPDGRTLYHVSDRSGSENLWALPIGGSPVKLTSFNAGHVLWPSISNKGEQIVFERDFSIWKYDIQKQEAKKLAIRLRGAAATPSPERTKLSTGFGSLALSPDGKKLAFVAHGEVFVSAAKEGGDATRVTTTTARESGLVWAKNSNTLYYISGRTGTGHLYGYNFLTNKETQITNSKEDDSSPILSPDGKTMAFIRKGKEIRLLDIDNNKERLVAKGNLEFGPVGFNGPIAWSPDGKWLAYASFGEKSFRNVYVVPVAGGEARPVSFLANVFGGRVNWSADGKSLFFTTAQRTENSYVAKVNLVPQEPKFQEDQFRDLFTEQTKPVDKTPAIPSQADSAKSKSSNTEKEKTSTAIVWEGISQRLSFLPLSSNIGDAILSKDGKMLVLIASVGGQTNLYSWSLDELSKEPPVMKQLTTTSGGKSDVQFTPDGKEVFFLENGRIQSVSLDSKLAKPLAVTAEMEIDFNKEKMEVFQEAWEIQNKSFYDDKFHGKDWDQVRKTFEPYAAGAQTPDELRRILNLMLGELNASHSGVSGTGSAVTSSARLGLRFDPKTQEEGSFKISEVIALGPADLAGKVSRGQFLVAIDGKPITTADNLEQLLENKINKKVVVTIASGANGQNAKDVTMKPVSLGTEKGLLYKQWAQEQREYVSKMSNGRLGYVHMFDMGQGSLDQLYLDMDAVNHAKEGVVVDIRNNNGGFVNPYAIDVLARKGYLNMTVRGLPTSPGRVQLGQRALDAPSILVTNQHSLSDAEDFSEGYRTLGLGKIVGEPTGGWIIFTGGTQLIDGSSIRLPFIKITGSKGDNMELAPRPVDIPVVNPIGETGKDRQLDIAVKELLKQIDAKK